LASTGPDNCFNSFRSNLSRERLQFSAGVLGGQSRRHTAQRMIPLLGSEGGDEAQIWAASDA
jgi:hypothetical protein